MSNCDIMDNGTCVEKNETMRKVSLKWLYQSSAIGVDWAIHYSLSNYKSEWIS